MASRQQVFTLIIEHNATHKVICERILGLITNIDGVERAGMLISGVDGGTVLRDTTGATYSVMSDDNLMVRDPLKCPECFKMFKVIQRTPNGERLCPDGHTYKIINNTWIKVAQ